MLARPVFRILKQVLIPKIKFYSTTASEIGVEQSPLFQKLSSEYENQHLINKALQEEEVQDVEFEEWKARIDFLKSFTFREEDCFRMFARHPSLLKIPLLDLENVTRYWFGWDFPLKKIHSALVYQPILFEADLSDIKTRVPFLRQRFRTFEAVSYLLMDCPNVMFDDWDSVLVKIDYLLEEKGFNMGDVLHSMALSFTMDFIRLRFDVVEKSGVFKVQKVIPHKKNRYSKLGHVNPTLTDILVEDDNDFANNVAKITIEEYLTCKELYETYYEDDAEDDDFE